MGRTEQAGPDPVRLSNGHRRLPPALPSPTLPGECRSLGSAGEIRDDLAGRAKIGGEANSPRNA
jgi:hypothetical protein